VQQNREEMEALFTLLADRYERGSVMITSNLPFSQWERIFKDPTTTAAAIDRLVHHSVIIELNLESYRLEESKKRRGGTLAAGRTPSAMIATTRAVTAQGSKKPGNKRTENSSKTTNNSTPKGTNLREKELSLNGKNS
jgi:hypothetical protein